MDSTMKTPQWVAQWRTEEHSGRNQALTLCGQDSGKHVELGVRKPGVWVLLYQDEWCGFSQVTSSVWVSGSWSEKHFIRTRCFLSCVLCWWSGFFRGESEGPGFEFRCCHTFQLCYLGPVDLSGSCLTCKVEIMVVTLQGWWRFKWRMQST